MILILSELIVSKLSFENHVLENHAMLQVDIEVGVPSFSGSKASLSPAPSLERSLLLGAFLKLFLAASSIRLN